MKRILSAILAAVMLFGSVVFVSGAAETDAQMLMRTTDLDTSWKQVSSGESLVMIGSEADKLDTCIREQTPNASAATTHGSQTSMANSTTLWMQNTNTWAFGYVVQIDGLSEGEKVNATVTSTSWGHDHTGTTGGGWINENFKQTFSISGNGTYTLLTTTHAGQKGISKPDRVFVLWVRNYVITFNKPVNVRFLAQVEAVSGGTHHTDSDFSSPAKVTYHDRDGSVLETVSTHVIGSVTPRDTTYRPVEAVPFDYEMPDYVEKGITYELKGWSTEPNAFRPNVEYAYGTMDVYPVYEATGVPFVNFMNEDGSEELDRRPIIPGEVTATDVVPTKPSDEVYQYRFDYWADADGNKVDITKLSADTTVYAHFKKELKDYTVTFYSHDGKDILKTVSVKHGSDVTDLPVATRAAETYRTFTFDQWVLMDGTPASFSAVTDSFEVRPVFTETFVNPFTDLEEGRWYTEAAADALINGTLKGTSDTTFAPTQAATRAMLVTVLYRLEGEPDVSSLPALPFTDVKAGSYYENAVRWAYSVGVVSGLSEKSFGPAKELTREQFATMVYRYAQDVRYYDMTVADGVDFSAFADEDQIHPYATDALKWMIQEERAYLQGVEKEDQLYLQPLVSTNRAMMATVLYRFAAEHDKLAEEFETPSDEFTPIPFWFWNDTLTEEEIERQIREFDSKGVNGFCIHPRMGLDPAIEYMGEEWLGFVRFAVELAAELEMQVLLYDEAMYPSGSCHGQVVEENQEYASRGLRMSTSKEAEPGDTYIGETTKGDVTYYFFESYNGGTIRGVYYGEDDRQANAPAASDLLNPDAVDTFIRLTHQRYYDELSEYFGNTIIGIFTDEPSINGRNSDPNMKRWSRDFHELFFAEGYTVDDLYYLFNSGNSKVVEAYEALLNERLSEVYYGRIAEWCSEHNIALTGHPGGSMDIGLLQNFDIPCQDIVWRYIYPGDFHTYTSGEHSTMGKCASDSARHTGKRRNGNECFGVCGHKDDPYKFTREDMKFYLDWLFSRGCNLIIPHAFYYSVEGARKDERPPQVGMNGEFWEEYNEITDYIKRCSAMNTDSVNMTDIALLCTEDILPDGPAKPLYENQIEFNYLETDLLDQVTIERGSAKIARQSYRVIVVDRNYDAATEAFLDKFEASGGTVVRYVSGRINSYLEALRAGSLYDLDMDHDTYLRLTRVRKYGVDAVFLSNEGEETITTQIRENVAEIWDAETGKRLENYTGDYYTLTLERRKSVYIILK